MALPLDQIPGYAGYMQRQQDNEKRSLAELMQVGKIQEMLMQQQGMDMQRQKFARENEAFAREGQYRAEVAGLGANPTQEQLTAVASRYASPSDLLTTHQKSLDRKAALEQKAVELMQQHENRVAEIREKSRSDAEMRLMLQQNAQQFQENMRRLMLDNRQPQAPVAVADPNDPTKSIFVAPGQAYGMRPPAAKTAGKPLPTSALKMQQEEIDALQAASTINADLGAIGDQIKAGKLNLGPVSNLASRARNFAGISTPESRNFATLQSTLEKMRNDSLRLNKGVQTEGDAQRAWNELVTNINDPELVKQRIAEIQQINERAIKLRKMNIDAIRANFGHDPMDTSGSQNLPPAIGQPSGRVKFLGFE